VWLLKKKSIIVALFLKNIILTLQLMILNYLRNGSGVEMTNPAHRGGSSIMLARLFF
jgi:hypothetical protein